VHYTIKEMEKFRAKWGKRYPKVVKWWEQKLEELLGFMAFPRRDTKHDVTANSIKKLFKELKRYLKVSKVLQGEKRAEKVLYAILWELNERYMSRKLKGFEAMTE